MLVRVALDDGIALRILDTEARIRQRLAGGNVQLCEFQLAGDGLVFQISEFDYRAVLSDLHLENLIRQHISIRRCEFPHEPYAIGNVFKGEAAILGGFYNRKGGILQKLRRSLCKQPEYRAGERLSRFACLDSANAAADEAVFYRLLCDLVPCDFYRHRNRHDIPLRRANFLQGII